MLVIKNGTKIVSSIECGLVRYAYADRKPMEFGSYAAAEAYWNDGATTLPKAGESLIRIVSVADVRSIGSLLDVIQAARREIESDGNSIDVEQWLAELDAAEMG